jgi:hypothetical protein
MQHINDILNHPKREIIEQRLKVIEFCNEFGIEATLTKYDSKHKLGQLLQKLNKIM